MSPSTKRSPLHPIDMPAAQDGLTLTIEQMAARFYPDRKDVRALADRARSEIVLPKAASREKRDADDVELRHAILLVMQRIVRERHSALR